MGPQQDFLTPMQKLARDAGSLLLSFFGKVAIEYKGDVDLVTQADRSSEKLIVEHIRAQWPDHDLLGEEGSRRETGSDYRWYIDPLDGTTNFAHGYPVFCVSMALEYKGERIAGVVYDPCRDEMFTAAKGTGAHMNGRAIHVSKTTKLAESLIATGFPSHKRHKSPNINFYHQLTLRSHGVRRAGSAALDLCYVASGRYDASCWWKRPGVKLPTSVACRSTSTAVKSWQPTFCCTRSCSRSLRRSLPDAWKDCRQPRSITAPAKKYYFS